MTAWKLTLAVALTWIAACSSNSDPAPFPVGSSVSSSSSSSSGSSSATPAPTGSVTTPAPTQTLDGGSTACDDNPPFTGSPALPITAIDAVPAAQGGTIGDGTYAQTAEEWTQTPDANVIRSWIRFSGSTVLWRLEGVCYTGTYAVSGTTVTFTLDIAGVENGANDFTATATAFTLLSSAGGMEEVYTKQ